MTLFACMIRWNRLLRTARMAKILRTMPELMLLIKGCDWTGPVLLPVPEQLCRHGCSNQISLLHVGSSGDHHLCTRVAFLYSCPALAAAQLCTTARYLPSFSCSWHATQRFRSLREETHTSTGCCRTSPECILCGHTDMMSLQVWPLHAHFVAGGGCQRGCSDGR